MRYWWVNQNQTYRHEVLGHYLWSPKRKKNGHANAYYDFMREVAPGDVVLSFADTRIKAIGIARSNAYEAPKPLEFGQTGAYWEQIGWRVDVGFIELRDSSSFGVPFARRNTWTSWRRCCPLSTRRFDRSAPGCKASTSRGFPRRLSRRLSTSSAWRRGTSFAATC